MIKSARARAFEAEHGIPGPKPSGDFVVVEPSDKSGELFGFVDPTQPRPPQPSDVPEVVTYTEDPDYPKHVIDALKKVVKAFNMAGTNVGFEKVQFTGGNRVQTHYGSQAGNHPDSMTGWMDGKENGLMVGVGLEKSTRPEDKKTAQDRLKEAEGLAVLDTLNDTDVRIAFGEPPEEVEASRARFAAGLKDALKPGAERKVDLGDRTIAVKVDAEYRNSLYKNPEKGMFFLSNLRLRSR